MRSKYFNQNKGITLIALVITIIVLLILAGVSIAMLTGDSGLLTKASDAKEKTEDAKEKEIADLEKEYELIEKITTGSTERYSTAYETDADYTDSNGKVARIPKGFSVGTSEGINTIEEGLVITDRVNSNGVSTGNEFVWIPVDNISSFVRTEWGENNEEIPLNSNYFETEDDAFLTMKASVERWKGFYIARYEAGILHKRDQTNGIENVLEKPLSKRLAYPYNYADVTEAINSSQMMYENNSNYGVTSTLCYGVQYDMVMRFIKDEKDLYNSISWGNFINSSFEFEGEACPTWSNWGKPSSNIKEEGVDWVLQTGACENHKSKNIYDLAGNVAEATLEMCYYPRYSVNKYVYRGSSCSYGTGPESASDRTIDMSDAYNETFGFRPALYIKTI